MTFMEGPRKIAELWGRGRTLRVYVGQKLWEHAVHSPGKAERPGWMGPSEQGGEQEESR